MTMMNRFFLLCFRGLVACASLLLICGTQALADDGARAYPWFHAESVSGLDAESTDNAGDSSGLDPSEGGGSEDDPSTGEDETLLSAFPVPTGLTRVDASEGSFEYWLRHLPVVPGMEVVSYAGKPIDAPSAAVVPIDIGSRDRQQCADSAIRLHAEWLWSQGREDEVGYHFTNGDYSGWTEWKGGQRFAKVDGDFGPVQTSKRVSGRAAFRNYLDYTFIYASTRSLHMDSERVELSSEEVRAGDLLLQAGSPGHVVVILDVAVDGSGARWGLIGQGFMPAQSFHVLRSSRSEVLDGVWFPLPTDPGASVKTPSWRAFTGEEVFRFSAGPP